ncbi:MAG: hypothetical protein H0W98_05425 [Chloroflexi bacterium]|nr:hypothetical protein [Chloroflexota bacterium]
MDAFHVGRVVVAGDDRFHHVHDEDASGVEILLEGKGVRFFPSPSAGVEQQQDVECSSPGQVQSALDLGVEPHLGSAVHAEELDTCVDEPVARRPFAGDSALGHRTIAIPLFGITLPHPNGEAEPSQVLEANAAVAIRVQLASRCC